MRRGTLLSTISLLFALSGIDRAAAQVEPYIGQIAFFAFNYCPDDVPWLPADGRQLLVNQYQALYALLGNTYGGQANVNFNVPDLRGRGPVGTGSGPNLPTVQWGQQIGQASTAPKATSSTASFAASVSATVGQTASSPSGYGSATGSATFALDVANLPPHTHSLWASSTPNSSNGPGSALLSTYAAGAKVYSTTTAPHDVQMNPAAIGSTGGGQPVVVPINLKISSVSIQGTPVAGTATGPVSQFASSMTVATQSPALGLTACIAVGGNWPPHP